MTATKISVIVALPYRRSWHTTASFLLIFVDTRILSGKYTDNRSITPISLTVNRNVDRRDRNFIYIYIRQILGTLDITLNRRIPSKSTQVISKKEICPTISRFMVLNLLVFLQDSRVHDQNSFHFGLFGIALALATRKHTRLYESVELKFEWRVLSQNL